MNDHPLLQEIHVIFKRRRESGKLGQIPNPTQRYLIDLLEQYTEFKINWEKPIPLSFMEMVSLVLTACDLRQKECAYYLALNYDTFNKYQMTLREKLGARTIAGCLTKAIKAGYLSM